MVNAFIIYLGTSMRVCDGKWFVGIEHIVLFLNA